MKRVVPGIEILELMHKCAPQNPCSAKIWMKDLSFQRVRKEMLNDLLHAKPKNATTYVETQRNFVNVDE